MRFAHGRTFGFGPVKPLRLLKFSRRKHATGEIVAEVAEDMTDEWFSNNIRALQEAIDRIRRTLDYETREFV